MTGIRAEITVGDPDACPVAGATADGNGVARSVEWTDRTDGEITEEFAIEGGTANGEFEQVFDYGGERVYRFQRPAERDCVCGIIEGLGTPLTDITAENGSLQLTLHLEGTDRLRDVIAELRDRFDEVTVRSLSRPGGTDFDATDLSLVDRNRLTERQREVLETAYRMGYFEHPRLANATEVAEALDIRPSTFTEHLAAAQDKLLADLLGDS